MATLVLVHGAWQGPWCWERIVPRLAGRGHALILPTLAGAAARAAELGPALTLDAHVDEVTALLQEGDLADVVLVGHGYAGMVITGVAERVSERLAALVYVDAFYPDDGASALDQLPAPLQEAIRKRAAEAGSGWRLPPDDDLLDALGIRDASDRRFIGARLTDWSLPLLDAPLHVRTRHRARVPRFYFRSAAKRYPAGAAFGLIAEKARADGCAVVSFETGHDAMIEAPRAFADALARIAESPAWETA